GGTHCATVRYPISSATNYMHRVLLHRPRAPRAPHSFPTRRSSDLNSAIPRPKHDQTRGLGREVPALGPLLHSGRHFPAEAARLRSEEHTSELQSLRHLVCRLLLEKKNK